MNYFFKNLICKTVHLEHEERLTLDEMVHELNCFWNSNLSLQ